MMEKSIVPTFGPCCLNLFHTIDRANLGLWQEMYLSVLLEHGKANKSKQDQELDLLGLIIPSPTQQLCTTEK